MAVSGASPLTGTYGGVVGRMRLIQHKKEAYWFYSVVSRLYDQYVNPLFWTTQMRDQVLDLAQLDRPGLRILDVGAGTGFTTEGIAAQAPDARITMLDQSPHQLARSRRRRALEGIPRRIGDAEELPFEDESFDRWVSAGSIEYWPEPQRALLEAHRVLAAGGTAVLIGPLRPEHPLARRLADAWMLFPEEREYRQWMERAGFVDLRARILPAPWDPDGQGRYVMALAGTRSAQAPIAVLGAPAERRDEPMTLERRLRFGGRFVIGSLAGAAFVPLGAALTARAKLRRRGAR
ncbi:MAG: 2-methyl-6-solanyl-1,4-benzoquinone methyltransferase [uncultured Solirubrobacteraceae bacterium]|uniref:2-methyl-6-solanyl-1,4-benzoquinone methyltransferase n=1 Tax=uncultured Solirubrobacteraceae bacterium TaxID=1162706 RepID=A0A6J4R0X6_9ACTN|nr:MAG: 2-methyl-6-solanyl-1,4-benzoquinone methyltransferase [uncultured Solirubrobacteraceae bacterium]